MTAAANALDRGCRRRARRHPSSLTRSTLAAAALWCHAPLAGAGTGRPAIEPQQDPIAFLFSF
jgi:hypothetical protein